MPSNIDKKRLF